MKINEIDDSYVGREITLSVQVKLVRQTSGPTVFELRDNQSAIKATGFTKPGERSFPDISAGDNVSVNALVKERLGAIELEILSMHKEKKAAVDYASRPFLIKSEKLEKLRPRFIGIIGALIEAIRSGRQILIRHHDDTDGYASGYLLEKSFGSLCEPRQLVRSSSRTPYYDYTDALRDLNTYLQFRRDGDKPPLVVLADLGSNKQSINSIRRLKNYGFEFIIIDHHTYDQENLEACKVFLNPHEFGMGSDLNTGALCSELSYVFEPSDSFKHLPALTGIADKSTGDEFDRYLALSGETWQDLDDWAFVIDYEAYHLKFPDKLDLIEDLMMPSERNTAIRKDDLRVLEEEFVQLRKAISKHMKVKDYGQFNLITVTRDVGMWDYASTRIPRTTCSMVEGPKVVLIEGEDSISFRGDYPKFNGIKLIEELSAAMPYAMIDGGGHIEAGTIKFSPISKDEVKKYIASYLERIK